jgi:toxin-antitoxin system PIN domain toxin
VDFPDINILVTAFRPDAAHHAVVKNWIEETIGDGKSLRLFSMIEAGFIRIVTHPRIFNPPSSIEEACEFIAALTAAPTVEISSWTPEIRERWLTICRNQHLSGNDCNDAMLAAIALERNWRLVTLDQGFSRFSKLKCYNPLG